jgi:prevent-host-death family protein
MNLQEIKHIGLREFQRSMYSHIKDVETMPLILTKNAKPTFVLISFKEFDRLHANQKDEPAAPFETLQYKGQNVLDYKPTLLDRVKAVLSKKLF